MNRLDRKLRAKWDALIETEGNAIGLSGCRPFLEDKTANDIFYEGRFKGRPCIVKCSSRAPDSILNEYRMLGRLHAVAPAVCPEPYAIREGNMAFLVEEKVCGDKATSPAEDILAMAEALRWTGIVHRDISPCNMLPGSDGHLKLIDFQFAIDRNNYCETRFMRSNPTYLHVTFGSSEGIGLGQWNDLSGSGLIRCLEHFAPEDKESRRKLVEMVPEMSFSVNVPASVRRRILIYEKSLALQHLFNRKKSVRRRLEKVRSILFS